MPNRLQNIISYVLPLRVETCEGEVNPYLEVLLNKGIYQLNTRDANYSFGSLYQIFNEAFQHVNLPMRKTSNCLVLGLGGGSVIDLIRNKYQLKFPITAVEADSKVIDLAKKYFNITNYVDLTIVHSDAFDYVKNTRDCYDLILIDLYINDEVPEIFHTTEFVNALGAICKTNALILFNKMLKNDKQGVQYNQLINNLAKVFPAIQFLSLEINKVENKVICINTK